VPLSIAAVCQEEPMRRIILALSCLLVAIAPPLRAQSKKTPDDGHAKPASFTVSPFGIWRATLDGVPSVTLTLADDTGELGGTIVFYAVDGGTRKVASIEPHILLHPTFDNNTLAFQIRRPDASLLSFTVVFTARTKAQIVCLNCGDGPVADLTKDEL
jgi:hypothetical protein